MHHAAWVVAPLTLVGVLTFSAVSKLGRGATLRKIIRNLRLPQWLLPEPLARAVPGIELALVVGLLAPWVPVFAGAAAASLVLMLAYWALIARGLTLTPRPSCGCFGQAGDHRISGRTLVRNTLLVAAAGAALALAVSGQTVWSLGTNFSSGDGLWLGLATLACVVVGLVFGGLGSSTPDYSWFPRQVDESQSSWPESESDASSDEYVRTRTPRLVLHEPDVGPATLVELSSEKAQLLVLVNCYCVSTLEVVGLIDDWDTRFNLVDVRLVLSVAVNEHLEPYPRGTLVDHAGLVWTALGLTVSPSAVLLGADGYLAGGPVAGSETVKEFVDDIEESLRDASASAQGPLPVDTAVGRPQVTGDR